MTGYDAGAARIDANLNEEEAATETGKKVALHTALDAIAKDKIDNFTPNLTRGSLGLIKDAM